MFGVASPCGLPLAGQAIWNGRVDEELRRELLTRRDEDQRMRHLVVAPKGQHIVRLPDQIAAEWQRVEQAGTR
jgi:hypothetical protein